MDKNYLTVEEFNNYLKTVLSEEELLFDIPVMGEASNVSIVSGHCYFNLKDKNACISVCCFNCRKTHIPTNGEKLLVRGSPDLYVKTGKLSIIANAIQPFGLGGLYKELEQLKQKLSEEGLFSPEHKKAIPKYPKTVGILTSMQGAAIQDILTTIKKKNPFLDLTLIDVRVQGEDAARDIVKALKKADSLSLDVLILGRGGGSFEDLYCFNDEGLLRTVFSLKTPIISAVGHETDFTLVDFVSDYRAITPTAAAEYVAFDYSEAKKYISTSLLTVRLATNETYKALHSDLDSSLRSIEHYRRFFVTEQNNKLLSLLEKVKRKTELNLDESSVTLKEYLYRIEIGSPIKILEKGFFKVEKESKYIKGISDLKINEKVKIIGFDGTAEAVVTNIEAVKENRGNKDEI